MGFPSLSVTKPCSRTLWYEAVFPRHVVQCSRPCAIMIPSFMFGVDAGIINIVVDLVMVTLLLTLLLTVLSTSILMVAFAIALVGGQDIRSICFQDISCVCS